MSETAEPPGSETPTNRPRRSLTEIAAGGGEYLNAASIPPRGLDTVIVGTTWEPNYDKTAEIPCLHLQIDEEETKLKVTTKGNASALTDARGEPRNHGRRDRPRSVPPSRDGHDEGQEH